MVFRPVWLADMPSISFLAVTLRLSNIELLLYNIAIHKLLTKYQRYGDQDGSPTCKACRQSLCFSKVMVIIFFPPECVVLLKRLSIEIERKPYQPSLGRKKDSSMEYFTSAIFFSLMIRHRLDSLSVFALQYVSASSCLVFSRILNFPLYLHSFILEIFLPL